MILFNDLMIEDVGAEPAYIELSLLAIAFAAALMLINIVISIYMKLGLASTLLVVSLRTIGQLLLLGYILVPVFTWDNPWPILGIVLIMMGLAAREAAVRVKRSYKGMMFHTFFATLICTSLSTVFGVLVVLRNDPWFDPQYLIPTVGMLLGNSLMALSVGLDRCLSAFSEGRDTVEANIAKGATRWEASQDVVVEAVRLGMMPTLNSMAVIGIVSIPGMMTGQILGGVPPDQAARYQIVIMFLIAFSTMTGLIITIVLTVNRVFDSADRLRPYVLIDRVGPKRDILTSFLYLLWNSAVKVKNWCCGCCFAPVPETEPLIHESDVKIDVNEEATK